MRRGDIVTVAPPGEFGKPRPCLIIQSDLALPAETINYLPLTSELRRGSNGLLKRSEIMVDRIQTTCNNLIMKTAFVSTQEPASSRDRVRRYRAAMRAKGYKLRTIWVLDTGRPGFAEECRRQSQVLRESSAEKKYLDELDLPDVEGWR